MRHSNGTGEDEVSVVLGRVQPEIRILSGAGVRAQSVIHPSACVDGTYDELRNNRRAASDSMAYSIQ